MYIALFLMFHKRHLQSDSGFTFSFSLSAVFAQTNANIKPDFMYCCKFELLDGKQANVHSKNQNNSEGIENYYQSR